MTASAMRLPGIAENRLAQETGLRFRSYEVMIATAAASIVASFAPTKGNNPDTTAPAYPYNVATILNGRLSYPTTICVTLSESATPASGTAKFRIRGLDQFGNDVEEVTPTVALAALTGSTSHFIYLAKVFAVVTGVHYIVTGLGTAAMTVGQRFDWVRTASASVEHLGGLNLGIGLPVKTEFVTRGVPGGGRTQMDRPFLWPSPFAATNTLTFAANAANNETVTIDGVVYTFKTTPAAAFEVLVGADLGESSLNLLNAINANGQAGYFSTTTAHPTVFAKSAAGGLLIVQAKLPGAAGNLIATTETLAGVGNVWSFTTLVNGYDDSGEVIGVVLQDYSGSIAIPKRTEFTLGYAESGWEGSIEKLSILKASAVGSYVTGRVGRLTISCLSRETGY